MPASIIAITHPECPGSRPGIVGGSAGLAESTLRDVAGGLQAMRPVVHEDSTEEYAKFGHKRGHRLRFRLLYCLAVFLIAFAMTGVLWLGGRW
jgi:hypothetical protein